MRSIGCDEVERYLEAAVHADHRAAISIALSLLDDGVPVARVLEDLLVAAQRETGARWLTARWTVADEHIVTTTTSAVVEAVAAAGEAVADAGALVVVCAEGDWHSMPARLFTELMRARGWAVHFLGASTPADHVEEYLRRSRPDGLAVTCALPLHFAGAARLVDVAHAHGIPALVGGAAIEPDPTRAVALGADRAVATAADADRALRDLAGRSVVAGPVLLDQGALLLDAAAEEHATAALDALASAFPTMKGYDERQLRRTEEDLAYIVRFAAAAALVGDTSVWTTFAAWQRTLLGARGVPDRAFDAGVHAIADRVGPDHPAVAEMLEASVR